MEPGGDASERYSGLDDPLANGISYKLRTGMQVQLAHDVLAVTGDRFGANDEETAISALLAPSAR